MVKQFLKIVQNVRGSREDKRLLYIEGSGEVQEMVVEVNTSDFYLLIYDGDEEVIGIDYSDVSGLSWNELVAGSTGSTYYIYLRRIKFGKGVRIVVGSGSSFLVSRLYVKGYLNR